MRLVLEVILYVLILFSLGSCHTVKSKRERSGESLVMIEINNLRGSDFGIPLGCQDTIRVSIDNKLDGVKLSGLCNDWNLNISRDLDTLKFLAFNHADSISGRLFVPDVIEVVGYRREYDIITYDSKSIQPIMGIRPIRAGVWTYKLDGYIEDVEFDVRYIYPSN